MRDLWQFHYLERMSFFPRILPLAEIAFLTPPPGKTGIAERLLQQPVMLVALFFLALVILVFSVGRPRRPAMADPEGTPHWIIIDGSNVMHWKDETPQIASVQAVIKELKTRGFSPG
ncbi:MAG: hypothetical protein V4516_02040, partial [Pseudomonadota bacterium]